MEQEEKSCHTAIISGLMLYLKPLNAAYAMRFLYANSRNIYPQDRHLIDGLRELGHEVVEVFETGPGAASRMQKVLKERAANFDTLIVGFTSPLFVIAARRAAPKANITFNAVLPQYEANIVSRGEYGFLGWRAIKWWLVDFISFHMSSYVLLESKAQIEYVSRLFFVSKKKLVLSYSGIDEKEFFFDASVKKDPRFTVLFRGRFLPESGILTVIEAAKRLENNDIRFLIIGHGFMYREVNALMDLLKPKNIEMISERIPATDLRRHMLSSHISLGQLAQHPRLDRTLPCKLFEMLALKLPYLTGRNKAVLEILVDGESCITANPGDAKDLAERILHLKNHPEVCERIAANGYEVYKKSLTSKILAANVLDTISLKK
jgi:glycosyltransferase involved in cell wall biosynthesis